MDTIQQKKEEGKLTYCRDRGAALARIWRRANGNSVELREERTRINLAGTDCSPDEQLLGRLEAAESTLYSGESVTYPSGLDVALCDRPQLIYRCLIKVMENPNRPRQCDVEDLTAKICQSYQQIFAILLMIRQEQHIVDFMANNADDLVLPLKFEQHKGQPGAKSLSQEDFWLSVNGMRRTDWKMFIDRQRTYLVPFFAFNTDGDTLHYTFDKNCNIPINDIVPNSRVSTGSALISVHTIDPIDGGHSTVSKIKLDPRCDGFGTFQFQHKERWYARKTLKQKVSRRDFISEIYFWKIWNEKGRGRLAISPMLCSWEKKNEHGDVEYCLLFPWASGDLRSLWEQHPRRPPHFTEGWLLSQSKKLADTLSFIHHDSEDPQDGSKTNVEDLYGRHGDIKPENILWFANHVGCDEVGTFLFSDFGVARTHPPEYTLEGHKIGRKADIWALGCTWIEFVTWFLRGSMSANYEFPSRRGKTDPNDGVMSEDAYFIVVPGDKKTAVVKQERRAMWLLNLGSSSAITPPLPSRGMEDNPK
ncbi:hypothetical protein GQ53DRAFT_813627 [Thozetella sp. PMI_491]|nr:hypothetical protein GQ53DRAFT_813627 [Thozetella sp. PMI_491]